MQLEAAPRDGRSGRARCVARRSRLLSGGRSRGRGRRRSYRRRSGDGRRRGGGRRGCDGRRSGRLSRCCSRRWSCGRRWRRGRGLSRCCRRRGRGRWRERSLPPGGRAEQNHRKQEPVLHGPVGAPLRDAPTSQHSPLGARLRKWRFTAAQQAVAVRPTGCGWPRSQPCTGPPPRMPPAPETAAMSCVPLGTMFTSSLLAWSRFCVSSSSNSAFEISGSLATRASAVPTI